jgi:hypothetical protein
MKMLLLGSCLLLASCATAAPAAPSGCPTATSDWHAWINAMPGPGRKPTLIVTGRATVPTGGYRFDWANFRVLESDPAQIDVELAAIPPSGPATQAITTEDVRGEWQASGRIGSVTIRCGGAVLARIAPVETVY